MISNIKIDGQDFTNSVIGLEEFSVSVGLNDSTGTVNVSVSNALVFTNESFDYLENIFFNGAEDSRQIIKEIVLDEDCCGTSYTLAIRGDLLEYCPDICEIRTQSFADSKDLSLYNLMKSTPVRSGLFVFDGTQTGITPQMRVCKDSGILAAIFFVFIDFVFDFFTTLINALIGIFGANVNFPDSVGRLVGCNAFISLFSIDKLLTTSIESIGGSFQSSIFQSGTYANAYYLHENESYIDGYCRASDKPAEYTESITEFLEGLKILFNADYRIIDGVLIFERVDFFQDNVDVLVDTSQADGGELCYSFTGSNSFASGKFAYQKDSLDPVSNSAYGAYFDRVEWNEPFSSFQSGVLEVEVPYGAVAFVQDRFNDSILDRARPKGLLKLDDKAKRTRSLPKVIILKPQDLVNDPEWCDARAVEVVDGGETDYNFPMYFNADFQSPELYQNFYSIENPREATNVIYEIGSYTFIASCEQIEKVINKGIDLNIITPFGIGKAEKIDIDFSKSLITINNVLIYK